MRSIAAVWKNTKEMPQILRMFCQGAMVAPPILALLLVLPLTEWQVNGRQVPYQELWSSGAGPVMFLFVSLAALGGWGLAARRGWARWLWVATPTAPLLMAAALPSTWFTQEATAAGSTWLGAAGTSALIYAALFLVPAVQRYVSGSSATEA
jgi:hypothetical protein